MSLSSLLNIASSGLNASSGGLTITGQNITNATTAGYTKRVASFDAVPTGGVVYNGSVRAYDQFAFASVVNQTGMQASADARSTALTAIEGIIAPSTGSIGDNATALMSTFETLTANPNDTSVRSDVINKATDLATSISAAAQGLQGNARDLFAKGQDIVGQLNGNLKKVADLNTQIANAQAQGADTADLRDQRDTLVTAIGSQVGVKSVEDAAGRVTLFGAGTTLVQGDKSSPLSLGLDTNGKMQVTAQGTSTVDVTSRVDGGALGGIIEARDVDLKASQDNLDSYAFDVANTLNAAHAAGYGTDGSTGQNLFSVSGTQAGAALSITVDPGLVGHPEKIAAAGSAAELPGGNSGATALAALGDSDSFGGTTIANRFGNIASDIGTRANNAASDKSMRDNTLAAATTLAQSTSGVSLDEEMVNMSKFQRSFEAASKVLQTADSLLSEFLTNMSSS